MNYRRLGRAGAKVSVLGLGTWLNFAHRPDSVPALVDAAVDEGINFFDTADTDGRGAAEELLGQALARHRRDELVLATKVWAPTGEGVNQRGLSRKHLRAAVDASLRRLGVDYLDLYQCQRYDPETNLDETVRALDDLVRAGKILYWGVSGWDEIQLQNAVTLADAQSREAPVSYQARYNILERDAEHGVMRLCRQWGLAPLAYAPLAQGVLTGKYLELDASGGRLHDDRLGRNGRDRYGTLLNAPGVQLVKELAWSRGVSPAAIALAWATRSGAATSAIMGASTPEQVRENAGAVDILLDETECARLEHV